MSGLEYQAAGVSIEAGDRAVALMREAVARTAGPAGPGHWARPALRARPGHPVSSRCLPRSDSATGMGYRPSKQARHSRLAGSVVAAVSPSSDT